MVWSSARATMTPCPVRVDVRAGAGVARTSSASATATASSSAVSGWSRAPASTTRRSRRRRRTPLAESRKAGLEDVELAVGAARNAFENGWSDLSPSERAKYLFRIARILQGRSREFAVLESLNRGKPIKESRDVDLPLAAAHFFYYAGWADKLEYAFPNRRPRPVGVAGQIIPWNFPLLMLAWKIAPALAAGSTVVLKPARADAVDGAALLRRGRQAGAARRRREHRHRRRADGRGAREARGVDKIAFTGSTEVGKAIQREPRGNREEADARARRQGRERHLRRRRARSGGRGDRQRHLLQPGPRLLRRFATVQESISEPLIEKLKRRLGTLRVGDPLDKNTDVGAINSRMQLDKIKEARRERGGGGRRDLPAALPPTGEGVLLRADGLHERRAELPDRAGGDLRAGALRAHLPDAGRGGREGEQHLQGCRRACGRRRGRGSSRWRSACCAGGVVWANTYNRFDPTSRVRRLQGVRLRPARRALTGSSRTWGSTDPAMMSARFRLPFARVRPLGSRWGGGWRPCVTPPPNGRVRGEPAAGQQDLQALPGRRVPALGVGPHLRGRGGERGAGVPQGRARRGPRGARARSREVGRGDDAQAAARCSTGSRRCWRRARPSSPSSAPVGRRSSARSTASSGTPGGRTSSRR